MSNEGMTGQSSEAVAAAFTYNHERVGEDVVILSICLEDGSVGIYRSDGSKMVEPLVVKSTPFDEIALARELDKALDLAMGTMESMGYEALTSDWRSHDRALQRFERSKGASDDICLRMGDESVERSVSASEWIRAFGEVISPALAEVMDVADEMLRDISLNVDETVVVLAGRCADRECMKLIREHFGSDTRLTSDHRFPQGMGDGSAATLVQQGRELLETGAVRRDRRIPVSISVIHLYGGDRSEDLYTPSMQLVEKGEAVSTLTEARWIGPIFGQKGDVLCVDLDSNETPSRIALPGNLFRDVTYTAFWVTAIAKDESILLGIRAKDTSDPIVAEGFEYPLRGR